MLPPAPRSSKLGVWTHVSFEKGVRPDSNFEIWGAGGERAACIWGVAVLRAFGVLLQFGGILFSVYRRRVLFS